jgi:uncharacterized membrane protein
VAAYLRDEFVSVYVPTTPNPTGGYFVMVRKSDCVELDMSVDAALKYIVSMGVVAPADPDPVTSQVIFFIHCATAAPEVLPWPCVPTIAVL